MWADNWFIHRTAYGGAELKRCSSSLSSGDDPVEVTRLRVVEGTRQSLASFQSVWEYYAGRHTP